LPLWLARALSLRTKGQTLNLNTAIGLLAGLLTTLAFVPQVTKVWRSKSARDVSLKMFLVFSAGVGLWLAYGILLGEWPIIVTNGATLVLALAILGMKLRYG
jgi:MtN3 and saliva related transmembrane protein